MNKKRQNKQGEICDLCDKPGVEDVRLTKFYQGVLIENLPAKHCPNCHEDYFDVKTVRLMERIAKNPERYAKMLKRPVARVA
ncbi:MAG: YgiT-type zinc finger protein [Blastocatellia bacterium]